MANSRSGDSMTERIVRALDTFTSERTMQTASDIARRTGLPSSTAHRIIGDLAHAGLLDRDEEGRVRLGMHLWELALRGSSALRLRQAALPHMERVQTLVREHTQLSGAGAEVDGGIQVIVPGGVLGLETLDGPGVAG